MQQMTRSIYTVGATEVVTIQIIATRVGNFATAVVDGAAMTPTSSTPLTYSFPVTVPKPGGHSVIIDCLFPAGTPDDARFDVMVSGSLGGGVFQGNDIKKTDPLPHRRGIQFRHV